MGSSCALREGKRLHISAAIPDATRGIASPYGHMPVSACTLDHSELFSH